MSRQVTASPSCGGIRPPFAMAAVMDGVPTTFHTPLPGHGSSGARRPSAHRGVEPRAGLMVKALNGDWLPLLLDEVKLHGDPLSWRGDVDNIPVLQPFLRTYAFAVDK